MGKLRRLPQLQPCCVSYSSMQIAWWQIAHKKILCGILQMPHSLKSRQRIYAASPSPQVLCLQCGFYRILPQNCICSTPSTAPLTACALGHTPCRLNKSQSKLITASRAKSWLSKNHFNQISSPGFHVSWTKYTDQWNLIISNWTKIIWTKKSTDNQLNKISTVQSA